MIYLLKTYQKIFIVTVFIFSFYIIDNNLNAQNKDSVVIATNGSSIKIYLDCRECNFEYVQKNIPFVDYVRDPSLSDVHIFVTSQATASNGRLFDFKFFGRQNFRLQDQHMTYTSPQSDTRDSRREGITRMIKMGLMPYLAQTETAEQIIIQYDGTKYTYTEKQTDDPWNLWLFNIDLSGNLRAEENRSSYAVRSTISANRATEEWKLRNRFFYEFEEENFKGDNGPIISNLIRWDAFSGIIKSLSDHWSVGLFGNVYSTSYRNIHSSVSVSPAVEYNFFPWKESSQRVLTLGYSVGLNNFKYLEETIYQKMKETQMKHSLKLEMDITQPWGNIDGWCEFSQYLRMQDKYSVRLWSSLSLRVSQGLSFRMGVGAESIHDQLYLASGNATLEEILLKRKQLATTYDIRLSLGIGYAFGSIYNNVVNRRL